MRKIVVAEFVTVDGIMEAPGFEEHRSGRNGWVLRAQSDELQDFIKHQFDRADAYLLGRTTYQIWAAFWPTASGDDELYAKMNDTPKYVVSSTLKSLEWKHSTLLDGDWLAKVKQLKEQPGLDIIVSGSAELVGGLMDDGLVDEFQLLIFPVVLGSGKHLFADGIDISNLRLTSTRTFPNDVVLLTYVPISAEEAPNSRFAEQYSWTGEQIRSLQAAQDIDRILATVLFTDIVGSSERAADMGDKRWRRLLDEHDQLCRAEVSRWHGRTVKSTGDGILATFDTPTRALRSAFGLAEGLRRMGIEIRAGIHTGEIELRAADDVGGIGVHIAARALKEAGAREESVVVTRTVRDLASGTDLEFRSLGATTLRGIPGEWELFAASASG